jgi:hypothetical protein
VEAKSPAADQIQPAQMPDDAADLVVGEPAELAAGDWPE